jgi:hypothetical protein
MGASATDMSTGAHSLPPTRRAAAFPHSACVGDTSHV